MTPEELDAIRAREQAATPGPWTGPEYDDSPGDAGWWINGGGTHGSAYEHAVAVALPYNPRGGDDAEFIVHAREDVLALLAEVARLTAPLGDWDDDALPLTKAAASVELTLRLTLPGQKATFEQIAADVLASVLPPYRAEIRRLRHEWDQHAAANNEAVDELDALQSAVTRVTGNRDGDLTDVEALDDLYKRLVETSEHWEAARIEADRLRPVVDAARAWKAAGWNTQAGELASNLSAAVNAYESTGGAQ